MDFFWEGIKNAVALIASGDAQVFHAVYVSVFCTMTAVVAAAALAIPYSAWLALYRPRASKLQVLVLRVGMFVGDDGNLALGEWQIHQLSDQMLVALIARVHCHGGVSEHGLGPGRGDYHVA